MRRRRSPKRRYAPAAAVHTSRTKIGETVWGRAWCVNLERYSDFENRLPRGRTYLRRGAVWHLEITPGRVEAKVFGTSLYEQTIEIDPLDEARIADLSRACGADVSAAMDLVQGNLPKAVLDTLRAPERGLFPHPREIRMSCSCPDWASLCKHLAAVLYGVGVRLDERPDLLFVLRGVDPERLVRAVSDLFTAPEPPPDKRLEGADLAALFDIELSGAPHPPSEPPPDDESGPADPEVPLVTRAQLLELGVSAGRISGWLNRGVLLKTEERGRYELTPEAWAFIEPLLEE